MNAQQRIRDIIAAKKEAMDKHVKKGFEEIEQEVATVVAELETEPPPANYVRVRVGEKVEDAFASLLQTGGIIGLDPGKHDANIVCPRRPPDAKQIAFTTHDLRLEDGRVTREAEYAFAMLYARNQLIGAFHADLGARNINFLNMGFGPQQFDRTIVTLGDSRNFLKALADVPEGFDFTRVLWLGDPVNGQHAGLRVNAAKVVVSQSAMYDCFEHARDSQCIIGWNGTRDLLVEDTFLEGGAENAMFGGSDCATPDMIPQDIEFRNVHFSKNKAKWMALAKQPAIKCHFEIKNAKRVRLSRCLFEHNWARDWPTAQAIALKSANQEGANPYAVCEDVVIEDSIIRHCGSGISLVAKCDAGKHSDRMKRVTIRNVLAHDINKGNYRGTGRAFWSTNTIDGLSIDRVTIVDNTHSAHDGEANAHNAVAPAAEATILLSLTNSLVRESEYGFRALDSLYGARLQITNNVLARSPQGRTYRGPGNVHVSEAEYAASFDADYRVIPGSPVDVAAGQRAATDVPVGAQL